MSFSPGRIPLQSSPSGQCWDDETDHIKAHPLSPSSTQSNEVNHDTQKHYIARWEDEGGANPDSARAVHRVDSLTTESPLTAHLKTVEYLMDIGEYEGAYAELEAAAARYEVYKAHIKASFDNTISELTTLGCQASPPHPKSVPLIKLRQKISA